MFRRSSGILPSPHEQKGPTRARSRRSSGLGRGGWNPLLDPLSLASSYQRYMVKCCFCSYVSSARGIQTHIAKAHGSLSPPRMWGRPKGPVCELCGWIHNDTDETPREGWANRRKRFERGKVVAVMGTVPHGQGFVRLGEVTVPKGAKAITKIGFSFQPCRGPFSGPGDEQGRRYCKSCGRYHFVAADTRRYGAGPS